VTFPGVKLGRGGTRVEDKRGDHSGNNKITGRQKKNHINDCGRDHSVGKGWRETHRW